VLYCRCRLFLLCTGMLAAHKCFSVTCQSCCCQTYNVDHLKKSVEHTKNCVTYECLCKSSACSHNASHSSQAVTSHESSHSQDILNVMCAGNLTSADHVQCTCRAESQLSLFRPMSVVHCPACIGRHRAKPENVIQVVRCDESVNSAVASRNYYQHHCCTCICQHCGVSGCQHNVMLSAVTSGVCVGCTKFTQVNGREQPDCRLTLRHSDAHSMEQDQEKTVGSSCGQPASVVIDVSEWQRRHIEQLDRQKLEV